MDECGKISIIDTDFAELNDEVSQIGDSRAVSASGSLDLYEKLVTVRKADEVAASKDRNLYRNMSVAPNPSRVTHPL